MLCLRLSGPFLKNETRIATLLPPRQTPLALFELHDELSSAELVSLINWLLLETLGGEYSQG